MNNNVRNGLIFRSLPHGHFHSLESRLVRIIRLNVILVDHDWLYWLLDLLFYNAVKPTYTVLRQNERHMESWRRQ
jgi:hypothetical protein